jgi:SAM-dependent methyltransferase
MLQSQPPHVQLAIQLYRQVSTRTRPNQSIQPSTNNTNPGEDINGVQHIQAELDQLLQQHNLTERDLHNLLQQVTWDASAYAKAARALTGEMPIDMQRKVQKGCSLLVEYSSQAAEMTDDTDHDHNNLDQKQKTDAAIRPTILDVGCGFGVLVPFLKKAGLQSSQIHGIDLSPEMIRHAQETMMHQYRDDDSTAVVSDVSVSSPTFTACDFLSYQPPSSMKDACYQGIIFCSSLHDMPNMMDVTLPKARDLLSPQGGVLVILHPQGASHVLAQSRSNPTMVPRGLPTKAELQNLEGFELIRAPTTAQSMAEAKEGYLAVLRRTPIEEYLNPIQVINNLE